MDSCLFIRHFETRMRRAEIDFSADRCFGSRQFPHHHHHHHYNHVPSPFKPTHSLPRTRPRRFHNRLRRLSFRRSLHSLPISTPTTSTPTTVTTRPNRPRPLPCTDIHIPQL